MGNAVLKMNKNRKMRKTKLLVFSFYLLVFISCGERQNYLERSLQLAGGNRVELEKVLAHYSQNPEDSLKLKAARFLIENMDTYYFFFSPELETYYRTLDSIYSLNERHDYMTEEQELLLSQLVKPNPNDFRIVQDLQYVSAVFLIDNGGRGR